MRLFLFYEKIEAKLLCILPTITLPSLLFLYIIKWVIVLLKKTIIFNYHL